MKFVNGAFDIGAEHEAPAIRVDLPIMQKGGLDTMFFANFKYKTDEERKAAWAEWDNINQT